MSLAAIWRNNAMTINCNALRCCVSPPIGQALAADRLGDRHGALNVVMACLDPSAINLDAGFAMVPAEIKFGNVTLQVLLAYMVECAVETALEKGKAGFDSVSGDVATGIFAASMGHDAMLAELAADLCIGV